jgi:hypothetical protein
VANGAFLQLLIVNVPKITMSGYRVLDLVQGHPEFYAELND